ncbi:hypothetical protein [Rhizobium sp. L9]|uniref:hypothetical protein n=1 Tax=Rhizobium sp. L9 TaxID=1340738 RepID=UPI00114438BC|nr:hypothetical protein [Rhizobium sp. L9]
MTEKVMPLAERLAALEQVERGLVRGASGVLTTGVNLTVVDTFILGAIKRTLSQSLAFRTLVKGWNFSSAAVMVRTQLDTAMRINGIRYMTDMEANIADIFYGRTTYRNLRSKDGQKMTDAYLKQKLTEEHAWVGPFYDELSDFVHLSFRHFWPVLAGTNDGEKTAYIAIHGEDPKKDEANYYDVTDGFTRVTTLTSMLLVSFLMVRHNVAPTDYKSIWGVEEEEEGTEPTDAPA